MADNKIKEILQLARQAKEPSDLHRILQDNPGISMDDLAAAQLKEQFPDLSDVQILKKIAEQRQLSVPRQMIAPKNLAKANAEGMYMYKPEAPYAKVGEVDPSTIIQTGKKGDLGTKWHELIHHQGQSYHPGFSFPGMEEFPEPKLNEIKKMYPMLSKSLDKIAKNQSYSQDIKNKQIYQHLQENLYPADFDRAVRVFHHGTKEPAEYQELMRQMGKTTEGAKPDLDVLEELNKPNPDDSKIRQEAESEIDKQEPEVLKKIRQKTKNNPIFDDHTNERLIKANFDPNEFQKLEPYSQFEPKHPKYLYHVTDKKNLPKILKEGLVPKVGKVTQGAHGIGSEPNIFLSDKPAAGLINKDSVILKIPAENYYIDHYDGSGILRLGGKYQEEANIPIGVEEGDYFTKEEIDPKDIEVIKPKETTNNGKKEMKKSTRDYVPLKKSESAKSYQEVSNQAKLKLETKLRDLVQKDVDINEMLQDPRLSAEQKATLENVRQQFKSQHERLSGAAQNQSVGEAVDRYNQGAAEAPAQPKLKAMEALAAKMEAREKAKAIQKAKNAEYLQGLNEPLPAERQQQISDENAKAVAEQQKSSFELAKEKAAQEGSRVYQAAENIPEEQLAKTWDKGSSIGRKIMNTAKGLGGRVKGVIPVLGGIQPFVQAAALGQDTKELSPFEKMQKIAEGLGAPKDQIPMSEDQAIDEKLMNPATPPEQKEQLAKMKEYLRSRNRNPQDQGA